MSGILIFLACLPSIILLLFIYKVDKFDKEPLGLLIKLFFFGMVSVIPAIILELTLQYINFFTGILGLVIEAFLIVALTEEFLKRQAVKWAAYKSEEYEERLDGIVYCVVASLGFATVENIMYVVQYTADSPNIWLMRALLSVPAHMLFGITMGYFMSMAKFCNNGLLAKKYASRSLWIPVLFHGLYDFFALSGNILFSLLLIPLIIYMWIYNIKKLKTYYKESKITHLIRNSQQE